MHHFGNGQLAILCQSIPLDFSCWPLNNGCLSLITPFTRGPPPTKAFSAWGAFILFNLGLAYLLRALQCPQWSFYVNSGTLMERNPGSSNAMMLQLLLESNLARNRLRKFRDSSKYCHVASRRHRHACGAVLFRQRFRHQCSRPLVSCRCRTLAY